MLCGISSRTGTARAFVSQNATRTGLVLARRLLDDGNGRIEVDALSVTIGALLEIVNVDIVDRVQLVLHIVDAALLVIVRVAHSAER